MSCHIKGPIDTTKAVTDKASPCQRPLQLTRNVQLFLRDQTNRSDSLIVFEDLESGVLGLPTAKDPYAQIQ